MIFKRSKLNPILRPYKKSNWQSLKTYNPGAIFENGKYHIIYRAVGKSWVSNLGHSISKDGVGFKLAPEPLLSPTLKIEKKGVEDPRITKINNAYYLTYTAFDGKTARLSLATSTNLKEWKKYGEMMPGWDYKRAGGFIISWDNAQTSKKTLRCWSKAGGIFPEILKGKYYMLFGDCNIWLAMSEDGIKWEPIWKPFIKPRPGFFDSAHVEMGPPPIKTKKGWLVIYHGIENKNNQIIYRLGLIILDINNPRKIIYRSDKPIFEPLKQTTIKSIVDILPGGFKKMEKMSKKELSIFIKNIKKENKLPKVIFCNGAVLRGNILRIYYGVGDTVVYTATTNINKLFYF